MFARVALVRSFLIPFLAIILLGLPSQLATPVVAEEPPLRWWKGNIHTHSLWSDGNDFPEMVAAWYAERDYNFLALSDHNILSQGMQWMKAKKIIDRSQADVIDKYRRRFGNAWVESRGTEGSDDYEIRLKPLDEFRYLLEEHGRFIMIPGEEITDKFEDLPVHMNATNVGELIRPLGGKSVREVMENNLRSVLEQEKKLGREILPHLNHPNFRYGVTYEDLAAVVAEEFFEVYNGHPGVNHQGDDQHPGIETMWDLANAIRVGVLDAAPLMGVGTDDSHEYHGKAGSRPGRGWVMVRARYLTPEHLIRAMKRGDFYASSGVRLEDVAFDESARTLKILVKPDPGATYRIDFIATLSEGARSEADKDGSTKPTNKRLPPRENIGRVVATVEGTSGEYRMQGNELYVRAVITSSLAPADPVWTEQKQQAWTQPVGTR